MTTPFITNQDVVDRLGRGGTTDAGMTSAVDSACEMCRTLSGQTFNRATTTEVFDGPGTDALVLPQLPVNGVSTVSLIDNDGGTTAITDYALNGNGVLLRQRGSVVEDWPQTIAWPVGRQNIRVTYDHGYGTVPSDVREVALSIATRLVMQGPAVFEAMGGEQIRYATASTDFTTGERAILSKYRQIG